jgi:hypothetical protein
VQAQLIDQPAIRRVKFANDLPAELNETTIGGPGLFDPTAGPRASF